MWREAGLLGLYGVAGAGVVGTGVGLVVVGASVVFGVVVIVLSRVPALSATAALSVAFAVLVRGVPEAVPSVSPVDWVLAQAPATKMVVAAAR
jgi:hypothetical protein